MESLPATRESRPPIKIKGGDLKKNAGRSLELPPKYPRKKKAKKSRFMVRPYKKKKPWWREEA